MLPVTEERFEQCRIREDDSFKEYLENVFWDLLVDITRERMSALVEDGELREDCTVNEALPLLFSEDERWENVYKEVLEGLAEDHMCITVCVGDREVSNVLLYHYVSNDGGPYDDLEDDVVYFWLTHSDLYDCTLSVLGKWLKDKDQLPERKMWTRFG